MFSVADVKIDSLGDYDTIIYCGGMYAGGIIGFGKIKKNYQALADKKLILVAVGSSLGRETAVEEVRENNLDEQMREHWQVFFLRGGIDYQKMHVWDRFLMYLLIKSIKRKAPDELDSDAKGLLGTYGKTVDFTKKEAVAPIIEAINEGEL